MDDDFDYNDTATAPAVINDFLMENLCGKKGQEAGGYSPPASRSAAKRWKAVNEQNMMQMLEEKHSIKKKNFQKSKEQAREIIRKIPVEILAKEWLSKEDATVDMRAYLVDHVLPTLILGVERLLKEVDEKGLAATNRYEPEFNPINFLAQYLMRNNPRFSNFSEASPYVRGLREVSEEIKQELFTFEDNRLARIKAEARRKRADREKIEQQQREAKLRRMEQLIAHFQQWIVPLSDKKVEQAMVQNALRSFCEIVAVWPKEMREAAKFQKPLEPTDETGKMLSAEEFAQYLSQFVEEMSMDIFEAFLTHMTKCAAIYRAVADKEIRRNILTNLFLMCDHGRRYNNMIRIIETKEILLGLLDRQRILELFEKFWDVIWESKEFMGTLRNPRRWPVIEVDEVDDSMFDAWEDEPDGGLTLAEMQIASQELTKNQQEVHRMATIATVQDKSAVEKWKIKQLSEKSEGNVEEEFGDEDNADHKNDSESFQAIAKSEGNEVEVKVQGEPLQEEDRTLSNSNELQDTETMEETETDSLRQEPFDGASHQNQFDTENNNQPKLDEIAQNELEEIAQKKPEETAHPESENIAYTELQEKLSQPERKNSGQTEKEEAAEPELENKVQSDQEARTVQNESYNSENVSSKDGEEKKDVEKIEDKEGTEGQTGDLGIETKMDSTENVKSNESEKETAAQEEKEKDESGENLLKTPEMKKFDLFMKSQQERELTTIAISDAAANNAEPNELLRKLSLPVGEFLKILCKENNINFNKQLADINANSCNRVRNMTVSTNQRSQSQLSAFDESTLNISQFVILIETFIGHDPNREIFEKLVKHIKDGYTDTEQEKTDRLVKTRRQVITSKRKLMIDNLFEKWDNDGSGYLEMEEVQKVLFKYKDGQELDVIKKAQMGLKKKSKFYDNRLSKQEFRELIELLVKEMSGSDNFGQLVEFLMNSVERSYAERIRGEARKKWLQQIITEGQVSGTFMDHVYKAVFQALYKDAEMHGSEKRISANIAMLEVNKIEPGRGPMLLRYAACTPEDCPYMLGKVLYKNMKGVSFQAVETGKPVHVPRVSNHGNIYFWNYDRTHEEKEGSFVVIPLKDKKKRVFGTLGIDTIQDPNKNSIFITHEIQFFQGVAKVFSIAYHTVEMKRKFLRVTESAFSWFSRRCPHITDMILYLVEPNIVPDRDPVLRKMMFSNKKVGITQVTDIVRLERKDNLFRDYLFQCMENSETVCADAYGERHTATPLRDLDGKAIGVLDFSIGDMKALPNHENKEAQRMLRLLQKAYKEIVKEAQGEEKKKILDAECDETSRVAILFDSLMLAELRENIGKLDPMAFAELKSYYQPPRVILEVCRAALAIFDIERAGEGQYEDWPVVKNNLHANFVHQIKNFDPTKVTEFVKTEKIARYLRAIPHGEIGRYGSIPAMLLYNWVFCCLSLIEHTARMRELESHSEIISQEVKALE